MLYDDRGGDDIGKYRVRITIKEIKGQRHIHKIGDTYLVHYASLSNLTWLFYLAFEADYGALLTFIAAWLSMNSYAGLGETGLYFSLNLVTYLMSLLQTNVPVHY